MKRIYLHPLPIRLWHWANALIIIALLATGVHLRLSGIMGVAPHSFPLVVHKWAGVTLMALWIFWLAYALASDHMGRQYVLGRDDLRGIPLQMKFYLFEIFKGEDNPFKASPGAKFNPLQKLAYGSVMCLFAPVMILTGLLFLNAFFVRESLLASDAYIAIDAVHTAGFYFIAVFLVIHIYMATLGPTIFSHIKTMIVGYEEEPPGGAEKMGGQAGELAEERKF